jgi:hypothetical protein
MQQCSKKFGFVYDPVRLCRGDAQIRGGNPCALDIPLILWYIKKEKTAWTDFNGTKRHKARA